MNYTTNNAQPQDLADALRQNGYLHAEIRRLNAQAEKLKNERDTLERVILAALTRGDES